MTIRNPYSLLVRSCPALSFAILWAPSALAADCDQATFEFWRGIGTPQICDNHQVLLKQMEMSGVARTASEPDASVQEEYEEESFEVYYETIPVLSEKLAPSDLVLADDEIDSSDDYDHSAPFLKDVSNKVGLQPDFFVRAFGGIGTFKEKNAIAKSDLTIGGVVAGADLLTGEHFRLSLLGLYAFAQMQGANDQHDSEVHLPKIGVQTSWEWDKWHFTSITLYGPEMIKTRRMETSLGLQNTFTSSYTNHRISQIFELGFIEQLGNVAIQPVAGVRFDWLHQAQVQESGLPANAQFTKRDDFLLGQTHLGVTLSGKMEFAEVVVFPRLGVKWLHRFGDIAGSNQVSFNRGLSFSHVGSKPDRDAFRVDAGLDFAVQPNVNILLDYSGTFSRNESLHAAKLGVRWAF